jgi:hypothetical protein
MTILTIPYLLNLKQSIMKQLLWIAIAAMAVSCNNGDSKTTGKDSTATSTTTSNSTVTQTDLPYRIANYREWEPGSGENKLIALNALKRWEEGKMDESVKYFGDSVKMDFDGPTMTLSNDSLKKIFTAGWGQYKTVSIEMQDVESVISKDKKEEWVTMWYRQRSETKAGVKDSVDIVNDAKIRNGKIVTLDEYTRKLH